LALLVQPLNDDFPILFSSADLQAVTKFHVLGRFGGGAVQLNLAAIYCIASQASGLEEAGSPKPFIEAHGPYSQLLSEEVTPRGTRTDPDRPHRGFHRSRTRQALARTPATSSWLASKKSSSNPGP